MFGLFLIQRERAGVIGGLVQKNSLSIWVVCSKKKKKISFSNEITQKDYFKPVNFVLFAFLFEYFVVCLSVRPLLSRLFLLFTLKRMCGLFAFNTCFKLGTSCFIVCRWIVLPFSYIITWLKNSGLFPIFLSNLVNQT